MQLSCVFRKVVITAVSRNISGHVIGSFALGSLIKKYHSPTVPITFIYQKCGKIIAHASLPWLYSCFTWPRTVPSTIPTFSTTLTLFPTVIIVNPTELRQRSRDHVRNRAAAGYFFSQGVLFQNFDFSQLFLF